MTEIVDGRFVLVDLKPESGAGGEVHQALDLQYPGVRVAIKFVTGNKNAPITRIFFDRETQSLMKLDHPNIVKFLTAGWYEERAQFFIAMEWVDENFSSLLSNKPWSDWQQFLESYAFPLTSAIGHAHNKKVIHRDIKPLNILVGGNGPKIADFGIAKLQDKIDPAGQTVIQWHTPPYSPVEDIPGFEYTRDVWALAVVFIEAMSQHRLSTYKDVSDALNEIVVPVAVRRILAMCIDSDASVRPANASVLHQLLRESNNASIAAASRRTGSLWLELTQKAANDSKSIFQVEMRETRAVLSTDLGRQCRAAYSVRSDKSVDRDTVLLYGLKSRLTLKRDGNSGAFKVLSVRSWELSDWQVKSTVDILDSVTIAFSNPGREVADRATLILLDILDGHLNQTHEPDQHSSNNSAKLLDSYLNLLDAREEVEQGDRHPLPFNAASINGRDVIFTFEQPLQTDYVGQEWSVRLGRSRPIARGEFRSQTDTAATLRFGRVPKSLPQSGELSPYLGPMHRAHERQVDAVRNVQEGSTPNPYLGSIIADPEMLPRPMTRSVTAWAQSDLDESKRKAVEYAIGSNDLILVEGPPGTGKTSFITEVVGQTLKVNPDAKILIVSQTHVAVDNAIERLSQRGLNRIVRLAKPEDPRVAPAVAHLVLDRRMAEWAKQVEKKARAALESMAISEGMSLKHLEAALTFRQIIAVLGDIRYVSTRITEESNPDTRQDLAVNGLDRIRDREGVRDRLESLSTQLDELTRTVREQVGDELPLEDEIDQDTAKAAVELLTGKGTYSRQLLAQVALQAEWLQRVATDTNLVRAFLDTESVLAGTCIGFLGHPAVRDLEFDLCILDEASKATATEALVPLARSRRWILVGDTRQLPPMDEELLRNRPVMDRFDLTEEFVKRTLFDELVASTKFPVKHMLREQYRMIRPIGDMISTVFYDGELISPNTQYPEGLQLLGAPVTWVDTASTGRERREDQPAPGSRSRMNRLEAKLAIDRLETIGSAVQRGHVKMDGGKRLSVLLIAPYRAQIDELERRLASSVKVAALDIDIQSVDAVQGREADVTIFTVTRSNTRGDMGFLQQQYWRRINVALSRSRYSLTIIGDLDFCSGQHNALREVAIYMKNNAQDCEIQIA